MNNFFKDPVYICTLNIYKVFDSILEILINWQMYDFQDKWVISLLKKSVTVGVVSVEINLSLRLKCFKVRPFASYYYPAI